MFAQIGVFLVDAVASFFVFVLLARFHFQWLRVPFRNPVGEFVLATTNWMVCRCGASCRGSPASTSPRLVSPGWCRC